MRIFQDTKPLAERERTINRVVRPLADSDLAIAFRHLSVLLDGGVSLVDSLTDLARIDPRVRVQQRWVAIARQVEQGHSLSSAVNAAGLTRHEEVSATLAAAEIDGSLSLACAAMDAGLRARVEHRRRLRVAMTYPAIAGVSLIVASGFLLLRVVPTLSTVGNNPADLPSHAVPLLWLSGILQDASLQDVFILVVIASALVFAIRHLSQRNGPGDSFELAAYSRILQRLRVHGSTLVDAMSVAEGVIGSSRLRGELIQARQSVVAGSRLAQSLASAQHIPPLVARLVAVGETSGTLNASLERVAQVLEDDAQHRLERLELIAPQAMLFVVGGLLLWIIISIVLPIYDRALSGSITGAFGA
jgi:type IV pilus assembly protein PilC